MKTLSALENEVLVLAPTGRDADAAARVLQQEGIDAISIASLSELCTRLKNPAGAVLIAEEALTIENAQEFKDALSNQEPWSNLPVILMTSQAERVFTTEQIIATFGTGSSISLLERPFRIVTLLASVRVALQAREKQYLVRTLLQEQAKALQKRDEFLSIASHELKTPITTLKLQVQMRKRFLKKGDSSVLSPDKVISLIDTTEAQVNRLSHLVEDMLDSSRIVNGKLTLNCQKITLAQLVQEVVEGFSAQFQAAGSIVELHLDDHVTGIWDRYRIEQVIANIFNNAIKYGKGKPITITVQSQGEKAILTVKDQGIGIAPENLERVFQRFERAVDGSSISGLGLGLYICRQILDLHQGHIRVESTLDKGSSFTVELPAYVEKEAYATR